MLALLAAVTLATAPGPDPVAKPGALAEDATSRPACKSNGRYEVSERTLLYRHDHRMRAVPLAQLPKANHEKAVLRMVDGCARPLVVGHQVGR